MLGNTAHNVFAVYYFLSPTQNEAVAQGGSIKAHPEAFVELAHKHDDFNLGRAVLKQAALLCALSLQVAPVDASEQLKQ